ncbi:MAG: MBL fold metallo-hydrolase [Acidimicrobiales bacterium]|nr:MBL fold metallo-hydrolase [Acidimicrobiales bacterium]
MSPDRSRLYDRPSTPILSFLGGTGTVTGSRFLIETPESAVLIDCGLFQGLKEFRQRNWAPFPFNPADLDAIIVTHAHIDHIGYLPRLVAQGFQGEVICSHGTADLAGIVLPDSGHLQEEEASFANRMGYSKHHPALPLYTEADALAALTHIRSAAFAERIAAAPGIEVTLQPAGHILGSATVTVDVSAANRSVLFSGDLGRSSHPILRAPTPPGTTEFLVMESTYGGRAHDDAGAVDQLADVIRRTAARGGIVLIPAFAVDRTEVVLFRLRELVSRGAIPDLPVYVDSPMALRALEVYRSAIADGASDIRPSVADLSNPFNAGQLHEIREVEDSKKLAFLKHPAIIVSASGMATGGRVLHHLARLLPDFRNSVALVGFQAAGTRGRRLVEGATEVKMLGSYTTVRAEIANIRSFSVHADHDELIGWVESAAKAPQRIFLVHGEPEGAEALRTSIVSDLGHAAVVPRHLERVLLS